MRNISDKSCRENQNTHFIFNNFFFETGAFYDIMYSRAWQATDDDMAHAHLTLATNTHSECVIVFFPLQQSLHERASLLRYTYIACLTKDLNSLTTFIIASVVATVSIFFTPDTFLWLIPPCDCHGYRISLVGNFFRASWICVSVTLLLPVVRSQGLQI